MPRWWKVDPVTRKRVYFGTLKAAKKGATVGKRGKSWRKNGRVRVIQGGKSENGAAPGATTGEKEASTVSGYVGYSGWEAATGSTPGRTTYTKFRGPRFIHHVRKSEEDDRNQAVGDSNVNAKLAHRMLDRSGWRQVGDKNPGWDVIIHCPADKPHERPVVAVIYSPRLTEPEPITDQVVENYLYAFKGMLEDVGFTVVVQNATSSRYAYLLLQGVEQARTKETAERPVGHGQIALPAPTTPSQPFVAALASPVTASAPPETEAKPASTLTAEDAEAAVKAVEEQIASEALAAKSAAESASTLISPWDESHEYGY